MITFIQNNNALIVNVAGPRKSEWKEGYKNAYRLISELIKEILKRSKSLPVYKGIKK